MKYDSRPNFGMLLIHHSQMNQFITHEPIDGEELIKDAKLEVGMTILFGSAQEILWT